MCEQAISQWATAANLRHSAQERGACFCEGLVANALNTSRELTHGSPITPINLYRVNAQTRHLTVKKWVITRVIYVFGSSSCNFLQNRWHIVDFDDYFICEMYTLSPIRFIYTEWTWQFSLSLSDSLPVSRPLANTHTQKITDKNKYHDSIFTFFYKKRNEISTHVSPSVQLLQQTCAGPCLTSCTTLGATSLQRPLLTLLLVELFSVIFVTLDDKRRSKESHFGCCSKRASPRPSKTPIRLSFIIKNLESLVRWLCYDGHFFVFSFIPPWFQISQNVGSEKYCIIIQKANSVNSNYIVILPKAANVLNIINTLNVSLDMIRVSWIVTWILGLMIEELHVFCSYVVW